MEQSSAVEIKENPYVTFATKKVRNLRKKLDKIVKIEQRIKHGDLVDEEQLQLFYSKQVVEKSVDDFLKLKQQLESIAKQENSKIPNEEIHQPSTNSKTIEGIEEIRDHIDSQEIVHTSTQTNTEQIYKDFTTQTKQLEIVNASVGTDDELLFLPNSKIIAGGNNQEMYEAVPNEALRALITDEVVEKLLTVLHVCYRYKDFTGKAVPDTLDYFGKTVLGQTSIGSFQSTLNASIQTAMKFLNNKQAEENEIIRGVSYSQLIKVTENLAEELNNTVKPKVSIPSSAIAVLSSSADDITQKLKPHSESEANGEIALTSVKLPERSEIIATNGELHNLTKSNSIPEAKLLEERNPKGPPKTKIAIKEEAAGTIPNSIRYQGSQLQPDIPHSTVVNEPATAFRGVPPHGQQQVMQPVNSELPHSNLFNNEAITNDYIAQLGGIQNSDYLFYPSAFNQMGPYGIGGVRMNPTTTSPGIIEFGSNGGGINFNHSLPYNYQNLPHFEPQSSGMQPNYNSSIGVGNTPDVLSSNTIAATTITTALPNDRFHHDPTSYMPTNMDTAFLSDNQKVEPLHGAESQRDPVKQTNPQSGSTSEVVKETAIMVSNSAALIENDRDTPDQMVDGMKGSKKKDRFKRGRKVKKDLNAMGEPNGTTTLPDENLAVKEELPKKEMQKKTLKPKRITALHEKSINNEVPIDHVINSKPIDTTVEERLMKSKPVTDQTEPKQGESAAIKNKRKSKYSSIAYAKPPTDDNTKTASSSVEEKTSNGKMSVEGMKPPPSNAVARRIAHDVDNVKQLKEVQPLAKPEEKQPVVKQLSHHVTTSVQRMDNHPPPSMRSSKPNTKDMPVPQNAEMIHKPIVKPPPKPTGPSHTNENKDVNIEDLTHPHTSSGAVSNNQMPTHPIKSRPPPSNQSSKDNQKVVKKQIATPADQKK